MKNPLHVSARPSHTPRLTLFRHKPTDWPALGMDTLCCLLLSIGVILAFDQLFRFHASPAAMVLHPLVLLIVLAVLTRRAWLLPAVFTATVLFNAAVLSFTGQLEAFVHYAQGLLLWWTRLFPRASSYNTAFNIWLVQWIIHTLITVTVFFLVRRVRSVSVLAVAAGLLFTVIRASGFQDNRLALLLVVAGMLPLLARRANASRRPLAVRNTRWPLQLTSLALCAVCALLTSLAIPSDTSTWKWRPLASLSADLQALMNLPTDTKFDFQPLTLQSAGLQPDASRLGGDITLRSTQPVLSVSMKEPMLLKGGVYDIYNGAGWETTDEAAYRLDSGLFATELLRAFDRDKPRGEVARGLLDTLGLEQIAAIRLLRGGSSLYSFGRVSELTEQTPTSDPLLFNAPSELFVRRVLPADYTYQLTSTALPRRTDKEEAALQTLAARSAETADPDYDTLRVRYTQLPDSVLRFVSDLAHEITYAGSTDYERLVLLEQYLRQNFTYTLTPGDVPEGQDFVTHFLQTRQGYCVYFASAMTVLARTQGIPARFVVGYGLESQGGNRWVARDRNAHAWVEGYCRGLGWVTFDPTAGSNYRNPVRAGGFSGTKDEQPTSSSRLPTQSVPPSTRGDGAVHTTTDAPTTTTTAAVPHNTSGSPPENHRPPPMGLIGLLLGLLIAALLTLGVVWRVIRFRHAYALDAVRARFTEPAAQAEWLYAGVRRQLARLELTPPVGETLLQFAHRVARQKALQPYFAAAPPIDAAQTLAVPARWRYGELPPSAEEVAALALLHDRLNTALRDKLHRPRYAVGWVLFGRW